MIAATSLARMITERMFQEYLLLVTWAEVKA
jgi:hypothetical protein